MGYTFKQEVAARDIIYDILLRGGGGGGGVRGCNLYSPLCNKGLTVASKLVEVYNLK